MLARLVIRQDFGALSVETKAAQFAPRQMRMKMSTNPQPAKFEGAARLPRVKIDQTEAFASAGLKPVLRMSKDNYDRYLQDGIQTISRIASEGLQFLRIEQGGDPVPQISRQKLQADSDVGINVRSMPTARPKIDVENGEFKLDWSPSSLNIQWEHVASSEGHFTPGEIIISWHRRPSIEISVEPGSEFVFPVNTAVGNYLDAAT